MGISLGNAVMVSKVNLIPVAAIALVACSLTPEQPPVTAADQPFAAAGSIEMRLEAGNYTIRAATDERIRVTFTGNHANAAADLKASGTHANLTVKDTPRSNFRATVEVPATTDITIHLTAGNLEIAAIAGSKDIDGTAGNVTISIPNANDYGTVDASVKAGDLDGGPFGNSRSGLGPRLKWSGPGKYTLRANLGAGNLELKH